MSNVLLTGGTGYIAAHTAVSLIEAGLTPILLDNFSNSSPVVVDRIHSLTGQRLTLIEMDVLDTAGVTRILKEHAIDAVIHCAAHKAVGESVEKPLMYYHNNVVGLISVLQAMQATDVKRMVLSSSATVYGQHGISPVTEDMPISATNPYGETKVMMERIVRDMAHADPMLRHATLRYFNPVGAHPSGLIGEHPRGIPNNLMPYIQQVAMGLRDKLSVYGNDYDTADGTGERDYIHVMDLAHGHVLAVQRLLNGGDSITVNLGTGQPVSVLQMVKAFEAASGQTIPYQIVARRAGDVAVIFADPHLAQIELGFQAQLSVADMCRDAWTWQSQHPNGYDA